MLCQVTPILYIYIRIITPQTNNGWLLSGTSKNFQNPAMIVVLNRTEGWKMKTFQYVTWLFVGKSFHGEEVDIVVDI